jgi:hypothetical protein
MTKKRQPSWTRLLATGILFAALAACGGSSNSPAPTYIVGGTVTGLTGTGLVLHDDIAARSSLMTEGG